jgi:hypothetical protein
MNFPCDKKMDCLCPDGVLANFTAEAPDRNIFFPRLPYAFPSTAVPTDLEFGRGFYPDCASVVSQEEADLCAGVGGWPGLGLPTVYGSPETTCSVTCEDLTVQTFTLPNNYFYALDQATADQMAEEFACLAAALSCSGGSPTLFFNTEQTCAQDCNGETIRYTLQAGIFAAGDQATADLLGYLFACAVVASVCNGTEPPDVLGVQPFFFNDEQNCSIQCANESLFTYTVPRNRFVGTTKAEADLAASSYACRKAAEQIACLPNITEFVCVDETYYANLSISGGVTYLVSGTLPTGVSLSGAELIGTPLTGGSFTFVISVLTNSGTTIARTYTVNVGEILTTSLPDATEGVAYSEIISVAGFPSPVFSVVVGSLPDGLSLDSSTGIISGTPTASGASIFTVQVSDTDGSCQQQLSIDVAVSTLNPIAWWKFEEVPPADAVDTVGGIALVDPSVLWSQQAGIVNFGRRCDTEFFPGTNLTSNSLASLAFTGQWMEMTAWVFNSTNGFHIIRAFPGPVTFGMSNVPPFTDLVVEFSIANVAVPWNPAGWHFVRAIYDNVTGLVGVQIDNGAVTWGAVPAFPAVTATGAFQVAPRGAGGIPSTFTVDEVGLFNSALTLADATNLYNGGAGRTCCPIT